MRRLSELERDVRELRAARSAEATTIGKGGIRVTGGTIDVFDDGEVVVHDPSGYPIIFLGTVPFGLLATKPGMVAFRTAAQGGKVAMSLYDGIFAVWDRAGNIVMSTDEVSGQGVATPYIGGQFHSMSTPTDTTSGGSFVGLQKAIWRKQHPRIRVWTLWNVTATTAEFQYKIVSGPDAGTVIAGPFSKGNGFSFGGDGPVTVPGAHLSEFQIDLEARVTSGVGSIGVRCLHAIGLQS